MNFNTNFLGVGWEFPVQLNEKGKITMAYYEQNIRKAIRMIIETAPGERVMRPDFGCGIHNFVFAVNSAGTATRVASKVTESLIKWEPRIDLINVNAFPDSDKAYILLISIDYRVRATNNEFNMVYPFYLEYQGV
ncbi:MULTISPECIES: GPW/gp25 family protein [unclassified Nostoc]|uniref:GPW/gp25 family protein n=1 Tax=unclassified Nostoc TaxID=2593658 RepID=UPI002AD4EEE7|nr:MULTISPECIES: GPW/gp25 family protein [unclassified Nostoc]MDZ8124259.1 GPW/gp25 family protein [Nostoc sp. CmiVER01]MDZ8228188.1 GPW/gp25 family protein [Nostoc sp. ChiVER01]